MKGKAAKKITSLILVAILVLSAAAGSSLAWRDFSQHKSNEFIGMNFSEQEELPGGFADLTITKKVEILEGADVNGGAGNGHIHEEEIEENGNNPEEPADELGDEAAPGENNFEGEAAPGENNGENDFVGDAALGENNSVGDAALGVPPETLTTIANENVPLSDLPEDEPPEEPVEGPVEAEPFELPDDTFVFTITFTRVPDGPVTVIIDGTLQEMEIISGVVVIELKDGQTAVIKDLPIGAGYKVVETPMQDYVIRSENEAGKIPEGGITAAFTNYYGPDTEDPLDPAEETEDKPKPPRPPVTPEEPETQTPNIAEPAGKPYKPVTGDESNIWLWALIICGAGFGLRYIPLRERK